MKKVLLVIIDALGSRVIRPALEAGRLPTMQSLLQAGEVDWESTSVFPSITPAATASLITGRYPFEHRVLGVHFYDRDQDFVHYFGPDFWLVVSEGMGAFFNDFLVNLNHRQLTMSSAYEVAERNGLEAACLNFMFYRGDKEHVANTPFLLSLLPKVPWKKSLQGPTTLCLGDFVHSRGSEQTIGKNWGMSGRFGFNDDSTGQLLVELAEQGMPDFTVAYFPDNDFESHKNGPPAAVTTVENVDRRLGEFVEKMGGVDAALEELAIVITGDHSQGDLNEDRDDLTINIGDLLNEYSQSKPGNGWGGEEDLMICSNLRAAQIYAKKPTAARISSIVKRLLRCERIDQVIWRDPEADATPGRYHVARLGDEQLQFSPTDDPDAPRDDYGRHWQIDGDLSAVAACIGEDHRLVYSDYPNALERIACAFGSHAAGDIWVTARPSYEFAYVGADLHPGGGSHGSLHVDDSTSPLIVAGLPAGISLPQSPRTVDVAPLCFDILNVRSELQVGASHASTS